MIIQRRSRPLQPAVSNCVPYAARRKGVEDQKSGQSKNPYPPGTQLAKEWQRGYDEGRTGPRK